MGSHHHHHHHHSTTSNIAVAFFLNVGFTLVELIGGVLTNSLAIMSDALHDLGDSLSLGLAWYFEKKSKQPATDTYSYGFKRLSLLGAVINALILVVGGIFIVKEAIPRIFHPEVTDARGMMWLALLGIGVNGVAVLKLQKGTSINERVVSLHLLEDVLGWAAVLLASIVMQFWELPVLDPLLSVGITLFIFYNVYKNLKESLRILLQGTPQGLTVKDLTATIVTFEGIAAVDDCKLWTMDGEYHIASLWVRLEDTVDVASEQTVKNQLKQRLHDSFGVEHTTIEIVRGLKECKETHCS